MGRLFWKSLFAYWAAGLIAVLGVGATVWAVRFPSENRNLALETGPRASFILGSAAATLRHGGPTALRELMGDWQKRGDVAVYAVDDAGQDLLGRSVPPDALNHARASEGSGTDDDRARRVRTPSGTTYLIFIPLQPAPLLVRFLLAGGPPSPTVPLATGILASLIVGALLSWFVARPIRVLRDGFESLARGQFDTRVSSVMGRRGDELADLGRDFDGMAARLQTLMAAQRSLLHDVSHELRSPLARLQAAIGLARQNPEKRETSLDRIELEAQRVDALVGQLLTLSRLEAGVADGAMARVERTDVVDLVAAIAEDARFEADARGRSVVFASVGEAVADVRAELVHRAVENVVRNAIKYAPAGTTVDVRAEVTPDADAVVVRVADRGPGVPEAELADIFQPFFRGSAASPGPGFGLGLAISRRAVEAHGGTIDARNRDGGGLEITIRVPLDRRRM
jgi:two-component system, OmpR family, sensor kinase